MERRKTTAWKKVVSVLLVFIITVGLLPTFSSVVKAGAADDAISKEVTSSQRVVIPADSNTYRVFTNGAVSLTAAAGVGGHGIYVTPGFTGTIILDNVNLTVAGSGVLQGSAMMVDGSGNNDFGAISTNALILLKGENRLVSSNTNAAGLEVWRGAKIIVDDYYEYTKETKPSGAKTELTAIGGAGSAGIGTGNKPYSGGHMIFRGGKVTAQSGATTSGSHGAGIGDAWGNSMKPTTPVYTATGKSFAQMATDGQAAGAASNGEVPGKDYLWDGTIIIYGDVELYSYGGYHGAGIGGACYAGNTAKLGSKASIIAVPNGSTITAKSADTSNPQKWTDLGTVADDQMIYLGDPNQLPIKVRTEDNREGVNIYMNLEEVAYANTAILALADRIPGEPSRNLYPDMVYFGQTAVNDGSGAWATKGGHFTTELEFYTTATTPSTNLNYERSTIADLAQGREAVLGFPGYSMAMASTVSTNVLSQGYDQARSDTAASVVRVTNTGKTALVNVKLTVMDAGKNYFAMIDPSNTSSYVRTLTIPSIPAKVLPTDPDPYVDVKVPLVAGFAARDTEYTGVVSVSVSSINVTDTPDAVAISQKVSARTLNTTIEKAGGGNVINNAQFDVNVTFEHPVDSFTAAGIDIKKGTLVAGTLTGTDAPVGGRHAEWKFTVQPDAGLTTSDIVQISVKAAAAKDDHNQDNTKSNVLYLTYSQADPMVDFGFTAGQIFNKNQANLEFTITANGTGSDYQKVLVSGSDLSGSNAGAGIELYKDDAIVTTALTYTVAGGNVKISQAGGFGEGKYTVKVKDNSFKNNIGNALATTARECFVRIPTPEDVSKPTWPTGATTLAKIHTDPIKVAYQGGTTTVTIYGKNFQYLDPNQLQILLPGDVDDAKAGTKVEPTTIAADGKSASYVVKLPRNNTDTDKVYTFEGFLDNTTIGTADAAVLSASTNWTGTDYGLKVSPTSTDYKEKEIDITIKAENIHHYSNLNVRVYKDGVYVDTVPCAVTESGEVVINTKYTISMNSTTSDVAWQFKLSIDNTEAGVMAAAGVGTVTQGQATPGIHDFTVSEDYDVKGSNKLVLDSNGGTVFFRLDGVNLHNFRPIQIKNNGNLTPDPVLDTSLDYEGIDFTLARLKQSEGFVIPPNRSKQDITYVFETYKNAAGTATGDKVEIVVQKPSIGVITVDVNPAKHDATGGDSKFVLTGKHMQVAALELRDQDRAGFDFTVTNITNDGSDAEITIAMPPHTGGLRNDIYNMEVYFDGIATGLIAQVEVGPSTPSITGGAANPNYYKDADATLNKPSEITVHGNYMFNYNKVHLYDKLYGKEYVVDVTGKDMAASVMVNVPSAKGIYTYDIYANDQQTPYSVDIHVGIPLGQSGDMQGADDATGDKGAGIKYEEFVGSGGGSRGGGYGGAHEEGFDLLKYQSERASLNNPSNPTVSLTNVEHVSREQLDLAASGAKTGMLASAKSGVIYVERNKMGILTMLLDTTTSDDNKALEGRIYLKLDKPLAGIYTGAYTRSEKTKGTLKLFTDKFDNKDIWAVHLAHSGSYGTTVEVAVKLDIEEKTNDYELYFYRMDRKTGEFEQIEKPDHYFDTAGYLHFNTKVGGDIVVTQKPLNINGEVVTSGTLPVKNTSKLTVDDKE